MDQILVERDNLRFRKQKLLDYCLTRSTHDFGIRRVEYKKLIGFLKADFLYVSGFIEQTIKNIENHDSDDGIVFVSPEFLSQSRKIRKIENDLKMLRMNFPRIEPAGVQEKLIELGFPTDRLDILPKVSHTYDELATCVYSIYNDIDPERNRIQIWKILNSIYDLEWDRKYEVLDTILHNLVPVITDGIFEWHPFNKLDMATIRWNIISRFFNYDYCLFTEYATIVLAHSMSIFHVWKVRNLMKHTGIKFEVKSESKKIIKFLIFAAENRKTKPYKSPLFEPNTFRLVANMATPHNRKIVQNHQNNQEDD